MLAWLFVFLLSFGKCTVHGYLYADGTDIVLTREDGCRWIEDQPRAADQFLLIGEDAWVIISIPGKYRRAGQVAFWYVWGSREAHFAGDAYAVEFGQLLRS